MLCCQKDLDSDGSSSSYWLCDIENPSTSLSFCLLPGYHVSARMKGGNMHSVTHMVPSTVDVVNK